MHGPALAQFLCSNRKTNSCFEGVYPADRLPRQVSWPCCMIINTDPADEQGEHWVAVYIDGAGVGVYFDSFGRAPPRTFGSFLHRNTVELTYNSKVLQSVYSYTCGYYCLYFLIKAVSGQSLSRILRVFDEHKPYRNDIRVIRWYHSEISKQNKSLLRRNAGLIGTL